MRCILWPKPVAGRDRPQKLCESRGDRPGLPVPNSPYGLGGRKATLSSRKDCPSVPGSAETAVMGRLLFDIGCRLDKVRRVREQSPHSSGAVWESRWPSWAARPNKPYSFRGRKAILIHAHAFSLTQRCQPTSEDIKQHLKKKSNLICEVCQYVHCLATVGQYR